MRSIMRRMHRPAAAFAAALGFCLASGGGSFAALTDDLVAHWEFEDGGGTTAADSVGTYPGTYPGTLHDFRPDGGQWVEGKIDGGLEFAGDNDYVDLPDDGFKDFTGGFSVALWAYPTELKTYGTFIDFGTDDGNNRIVLMNVDTSDTVRFAIFKESFLPLGEVNMMSGIELFAWQHFAATLDDLGEMVLYKNGGKVDTKTGIEMPPNVLRTVNLIGKNSQGALYYQGTMDDVRIYDRALTEAEVIELSGGAVTEVVVTPVTATIAPAGTAEFTAEPRNAGGEFRPATVTWEVSGGGEMLPLTGYTSTFTSDGTESTFVVTATSVTIPGTANVVVTSTPTLSTISVTPETAGTATNGSQLFTAEPLDHFGNPIAATVDWTVDFGGDMSPTPGLTSTFTSDSTVGTFTVTADAGGGIQDTATVTVEAPVLTTISVTPPAAALLPAGNQLFTAAPLDQFGDPIAATVNWTVSGGGTMSDPTGATSTFNSGGTEGTFTVTADGGGGVLGTAKAVVTSTPVLWTVTILPAAPTVGTGGAQTFSVETLDQSGAHINADVTFTPAGGTFDPTTVDTGTATTTTYTAGATAGSFTVKAAGTGPVGSVEDTATVTIEDRLLTTITVTPTGETIPTGGSLGFAAETLDQFGDPIAVTVDWTVDTGGTMSPLTGNTSTFNSDGSTTDTFTVTASSGGVDGTATLTVEDRLLTTVTVTPGTATIGTNGSRLFTAEPLDQFGEPIAETVNWTVSGGGSMSPLTGYTSTFTSDGTVSTPSFTVTASFGGTDGTAEVTVAVRELDTVKVNPRRPEIVVREEQKFTAVTLDQFGDAITVIVTWTVDAGGTMSPPTGETSTFTSDGTVGTFTVTATADGPVGPIAGATTIKVLKELEGLARGPGCLPAAPTPAAALAWAAAVLAALGVLRRRTGR